MKASVRWLRELCPQLPDDADALAARFTAAGLEVEAIHGFGQAAEACLIATVVSTRPHPSRDGLRLVTVHAGSANQEVVCGAPNVPEPGALVVLAPLGTHLPAKGLTIERRTIAGVPSEGMLCSEAELGIGDDADGILVLAASTAAPGTSLARALPVARDTILELGLPANRADALGHVGLAREAAALFGVAFAPPAVPAPARVREDDLAKHVTVNLEDAERVAHYGAALLVDAAIAASLPELRWRLAALGVRPISNVVDVTNLVMLETGHPLHAFDLDRVQGTRIVVRRARDGETLVTLDGVERALSSDDLVICDDGGPIALAGVMGGRRSEITPSTSRVLLECATFDPRGVRRAARRHGLHTESSHRFERGVDWADTTTSLARATALVADVARATALGKPRLFEARALARSVVPLREERVRSLLGADVSRSEARAILGRLGFARLASAEVADSWEVPSHRGDVSREVDLIEEVARVRGYDTIPTELPAIRPLRDQGPREALARRVRNAAVAVGLSEAITYSFVAPRDLATVGAPPPAVALRNPLREEQSVMRTSLLPGLLQALSRARRHGERDARLFSVGTLFLASSRPPADERLAFAAVLAGARPAWLGKPQSMDVWDAKGLAEALVRRLLRREVSVDAPPAGAGPKHLHPRGAAWIAVDGERVGALGPLHPDVADAFDLGEDTAVVVEFDLETLAAQGVRPVRFVPPPRFPATLRDIAVVVRDEVRAGDLEHAVRHAAGDLAEQVTLFDSFAGGSIPAGHASLALRVVYRAPDRTLTDAEVDARHAKVVAEIQSRFGGQLRT
jgi:phenylalanyl-tRNA synthetase beta chain